MMIGPSVEKAVAREQCNRLMKLNPNERACQYDRLLYYLRLTDKTLAKALEEHQEHILSKRQDR